MKVRTKYKITPSFIAGMEVMVDNSYKKGNDSEEQSWKISLVFVKSVKEMDMAQMSIAQINWLTSISQKLRLEGLTN